MSTRRSRTSHSIARQSAELAIAVPQVMAHRMTRMALAGAVPSERDRKEFEGMVAEKQAAFTQAWVAMTAESLRANQAMVMSLVGNMLNPFAGTRMTSTSMATDMHKAAMDVLSVGLAPLHRQAVSNARRLAKTKLR